MKIRNVILIGFGLLLLSCNPTMEIPAYIYVENVDFYVTDFAKQGTASFKIPDVAVTVNGKGIGTYQLPALIPVLASGNTELIFEGGIKLNGSSDFRPVYPLLTLHKEIINLTKKEIDTIFPVFTYQDIVQFPLKEDFESAGLNFYPIDKSAKLEKTNNPELVFHYRKEPNNFSGIINLPSADNSYFFEIKSTKLKLNSNIATDCFVELNYCFDEDVEIGMYCYFSPNSSNRTQQIAIAKIFGKKENKEWNKIYVNLTDEMGTATTKGLTDIEIYMKSGIPQNTTARFLFDNIKVVYH